MTHQHSYNHLISGRIRTAFFLNLGFTVFELIGGIWTNSLAILSDALHDLGDSFVLGFSWYLENLAHKEEDEKYSYGYRRYSLLGALINTLVLITGSLIILSQAIPRLINPQHSNAKGMIFMSIFGIVVNGIAVLRLRDGSKNLNSQVMAWHLLEDVLGWVVVLIVSLTLLFSDIHILDPLLSILITLYVLINVVRNLRKTLALFLQAVPDDLDIQQVEHRFSRIQNVLSTHHTHAWSLDGEHHVLTTHLVVPATLRREEVLKVKRDVQAVIKNIDLAHTTIEVEYEDEDCWMKNEPDCRDVIIQANPLTNQDPQIPGQESGITTA